MIKTVQNIWKISELRNRILFTLGILIIYRLGAFIPVPNINIDALKAADVQNSQGVFGLINTFSGGALFQFSIFAMGIMPYITASIIVQLLSMDVVPRFTQWAKEGEVGKRKLAQITRYGTVVLGLVQAYGLSIGFNNLFPGLVLDTSFTTFTLIAIVLTAGTAFLMWLGEQITEKGIGNGISILIFAGIVANIPTAMQQINQTLFTDTSESALFLNILKILLIALVVIAIVVGVIFVQQGVRKIPVQYAKRVVGRKMYGGQSTHIPLKVNAAGVIPVIFALSLLLFPYTIASFFSTHPVARWIIDNTYYTAPLGMVLYVLLIIGFTFFYTFVQINPVQMADNMKKNGGYIPGIRPGQTTTKYLTKVISRITLFGAFFLAIISIMPVFFGKMAGLPNTVTVGGTSLLIVVGVGLETMKQIESHLIKRHYKGFINR
ncbi:preprotein translocase subunit SecY [Paenibacillus thermotolerans]|uniref:preprotein translocase subunit SecY n=1 Tax=Paenibacillus thermotolerans TaxID=3027807 RepID=UPI002368850C|nr:MULTISPECIES: preprotein translocase subunit SecY [unclassified Paenibacillus]